MTNCKNCGLPILTKKEKDMVVKGLYYWWQEYHIGDELGDKILELKKRFES